MNHTDVTHADAKHGTKTKARISARIHAFNLVFGLPFFPEHSTESLCGTVDDYLDGLPGSAGEESDLTTEPDGESAAYIRNVTEGVFLRCAELDDIIERFLQGWELKRLAYTDLAILRLALYEIRYRPEIRTAISIDQAVELSKLYSPDGSPSFVNGLLGQASGEAARRKRK